MAIRAEGSDLSVAATEFRATLGVLGLTQRRVAEIFNVAPRSIRRWQSGDRRVPHGIALVMRLLAAEVITITQA
jgi:transcriptional regulator with XRE-family HTH domain